MTLITIEGLKAFLANHTFELAPTQTKLSFPVIRRMQLKMLHKIDFAAIKVDQQLVIEGHHRYISSLICGVKMDTWDWTKPHCVLTHKWTHVVVDEMDWDKQETVRRYMEIYGKGC